MGKNLHIEHPEDSILNGDLSVLNWFVNSGYLSTKIDGSPAIVFGTNPENGKFFVGTKSVFNKIKIKICYTQEDVFSFYDEKTHASLIEILCTCIMYLPRIGGIIQADFIGFGGDNEYTPNTITYQFPEVVTQNIIVAPHTVYTTTTNLHNAISQPMKFDIADTSHTKFVKPKAYIPHGQESFADVQELCNFARQMSTTCEFVSGKQLIELKKQLNVKIREGLPISDTDTFDCDINLIRLWVLVKSIKDDCLYMCRNCGPAVYINGNRIDAEGYVMTNDFGMFKLVNREVFSHANFNNIKVWSK